MGWFDQQAQQMPQQGGSLAALGGGVGRNAPIYNPVQPPQSGPQPVPGMPPQPMRDLMPGGAGGGGWFDPGWGSEGPGGIGGHNDQPNWRPPWMQQGTTSVIDPTTGLPMSQQDYQNTQNRYNELQQQTPYSQDPMKPNPANPGQAEMDVLNKRMAAWQAAPGNAPVMHLMDQGNRGSGQPINQPNLGMADNPTAPVRQPGFVPPDPSQMAYTTGMGSLQSLGGFGMDPAAVQRGAQGAAQIGQMVNLRGPDGSTKAVPQSDLAHWLSRGAQQIQGAF